MRSLKRRANSFTTSPTIKLAAIALCLLAALTISLYAPRTGGGRTFADGRGECVVEMTTGQVLHERNAGMRMPMASTTKIMTALIVIEDCCLDDVVTVPDEAVGVEGSSIYLRKGEEIGLGDLVYGLVLRSGNDAATALAVIHSGSLEEFVRVMNERAEKMGLKNTRFKNPSGLPDDGHFTTASELARLACEAMKNQTFRKIVSTRSYTGKYRSFVNKNKILSELDGANGVKTGYTLKAGRCLVSSAEREGMDVICVVLNCPDMYERSKELIDEAFNRYKLVKMTQNMVFMCGIIPCKIADECNIVIRRDGAVDYRVIKCGDGEADSKGIEGQLEIYLENNLIFSGNLYSIITE